MGVGSLGGFRAEDTRSRALHFLDPNATARRGITKITSERGGSGGVTGRGSSTDTQSGQAISPKAKDFIFGAGEENGSWAWWRCSAYMFILCRAFGRPDGARPGARYCRGMSNPVVRSIQLPGGGEVPVKAALPLEYGGLRLSSFRDRLILNVACAASPLIRRPCLIPAAKSGGHSASERKFANPQKPSLVAALRARELSVSPSDPCLHDPPPRAGGPPGCLGAARSRRGHAPPEDAR